MGVADYLLGPTCLVPVPLLQFPVVCCLRAWVRFISVTSPRRMECDVTETNLGVNDRTHGERKRPCS